MEQRVVGDQRRHESRGESRGRAGMRVVADRVAAWTTTTKIFWVLFLAYLVLTLLIVTKSPILDIDAWVRFRRIRGHHQNWTPFVHTYVILGQRGPATLAALPWFLWVAYRRRSAKPLVMLVVALAVLNLSVGIVKLAVGRISPRDIHPVVDAVFSGGDIYPSGHISNAVVLYGLIAMVAAPRYRTLLAWITVFITVTVSLGTIFLNTHWVTDVFGGMFAGGLVLCSLQWLVPPGERLVNAGIARIEQRRRRSRPVADLPPAPAATRPRPVEQPVVVAAAHDEPRRRAGVS